MHDNHAFFLNCANIHKSSTKFSSSTSNAIGANFLVSLVGLASVIRALHFSLIGNDNNSGTKFVIKKNETLKNVFHIPNQNIGLIAHAPPITYCSHMPLSYHNAFQLNQ